MGYLTDRRAAVRDDPRQLLPSARSVICAGKLYQTPWPHSTRFHDEDCAWISRYAWGEDYHDVVRRGLEHLDRLLRGVRSRRIRIAHLCGYGAAAGAQLRAPGGAGVDRPEYLPDQPGTGVVVLPGRTAGVARYRAGRSAAGPLRHLHALRGGVSDCGDRPGRRGWTPRSASRTSRSSCAAKFPKSSAPESARTSSAATSARTFARGMGGRR